MRYKGSILTRKLALSAFSALFFVAGIQLAFAQEAQEPPLDVAGVSKLPARDLNAITVNDWLLYPLLRVQSLYADNLFLSPTSPITVPGFGVAPGLRAIWSNGIHTTTLYGDFDREVYPTDNQVNTFNARAGFTQKYEAMRDLIVSVDANYIHQTLFAGLQNSIQTPTAPPTTTVLPNGNTVLPNGTILSPSGQPVGQVNAPVTGAIPLVVNPSDQFTGTFSVDKIFNRGILSLSGAVIRTAFENQTLSPDSSARTFTERAAFWLGPLFYAYSNGSVGTVVTDATSGSTTSPSLSTTSYRVIAGLGSRQLELIHGSIYFGHQGSEGGGFSAGGAVYGGALSYQPTAMWTFSGTVDRTTNISSQPTTLLAGLILPSQTSSTNLALTLPGVAAVQVPLSASTVVTSAGLKVSHQFTQQWFANCQMAYTHIESVAGPIFENSWVFDANLRYDIFRNMSLIWEYRHIGIISNAPLTSTSSNLGLMSATYKF